MIYEQFDDWFFELEGHALRAERFWEGVGQFQSDAGYRANLVLWLQAAFEAGASQAEAKQAVIDRLMLEYCPNEMTVDQLVNWSNHQCVLEEENGSKE